MPNSILPNPGVKTTPHPRLATAASYMSVYDFSHQFLPEKFTELFPRYGNGKLTSFCKFMGKEDTFASDKVIWAEQGRLHQFVTNVTVTGDSFNCGVNEHNLRIGETIWISDGTKQLQADVYEITSKTVFKAHNRSTTGAFGFTGTVNLFVSGNEFAKKTNNFTEGKQENPEIKEAYPHILKAYYDVAGSDMARLDWLSTEEGGTDRWFVYEWERERMRFENLIEITAITNERAIAGSAAANAGKQGMDGVIPQLKKGANVGSGYIDSLDDIDDWTKRLRKQGKNNVYTLWNDQEQMIRLSNMLSAVNAPFAGGANYGMFDNKQELSIHLDFGTFVRNGFTFHSTRMEMFDDPTMFGGEKFVDTGVGSLWVPGGETYTTENGETKTRPYMVVRNRKSGDTDRTLITKLFGTPENPISADKMAVEYLKEYTVQVVGANEWAVNNRK
ncbi:hypothetical protein [Capnocytophaga canis]|uniref:hypothetical protein n=1 Tax=Capnocytophaga canis TaxID=1848903 RepID=UPI0037D4D963